jgi:SAM-dependent methyltransferase
MLTAYQDLADIYDELQQGLDIKAWSDYIVQADRLYSRRQSHGDGKDGRPLLVDLGCGTGSFCLEMVKRGYDPVGIDASPAMLDVARRKDGDTCLFLQQDISRFELYGTADLIVCLLDTVNHLVRPGQAARIFSLCANYLNPGGLFIFDTASRMHLEKTLGRQCYYQDTEDYTLLWQNHYRPENDISRSELLLFRRCGDGSYRRSETAIAERYYSPVQIRRWIRDAGLELAETGGQPPLKPPAGQKERRFYIVRKPSSEQVKGKGMLEHIGVSQ